MASLGLPALPRSKLLRFSTYASLCTGVSGTGCVGPGTTVQQGLVLVQGVCSVVLLGLALCGPMDCIQSGSSVHGSFSCKNTGVGCHALLQGIFLTQGLNPHLLWLLHYRWIFTTEPLEKP